MTNKGSSPNSFFPAGRLPLPSVLVFVLFLLSSLFSVQDVRATPSNKVKFVSLLANDAVLDRYAHHAAPFSICRYLERSTYVMWLCIHFQVRSRCGGN